jgi:pyridoxamine 5'-phosphate oxidase
MSDQYFLEALRQFDDLLQQARDAGDPEPTAMTLATVSAAGQPSARTVLLKTHDQRGFVFYTHCTSQKGQELLQSPRAALLFHWKGVGHGVQVRIEGRAELVPDAEADNYFATRPRPSQIGAWASLQTQTLETREQFEQRINGYEARFAGVPVPRPPHWSGFRVVPDRLEFWYGAEFRLHRRELIERGAGGWKRRMLYP